MCHSAYADIPVKENIVESAPVTIAAGTAALSIRKLIALEVELTGDLGSMVRQLGLAPSLFQSGRFTFTPWGPFPFLDSHIDSPSGLDAVSGNEIQADLPRLQGTGAE